jgi:hypothetical protein
MKKHQGDPSGLSRRVRYCAQGFFCLYLLGSVLGWLAPLPLFRGALGGGGMFEVLLQLQGMPFERVAAMPYWQRALGLALALPALLALGDAVRQLAAMLRGFEHQVVFTPLLSRQFRRFSAGLLAGTLLTMVEPTLRAMVFGLLEDGPGAKLRLVLDVTGGDLWTLLLCTVFFALAQILHEGQRLADENSGFV